MSPRSALRATSRSRWSPPTGCSPSRLWSWPCSPLSARPDHAGGDDRHLLQGAQELPAGLLAAPAGLGADPAVRVVLGMPLALVTTALADGHASLQQRPGDVGVVLRQAADDPAGGSTDIRAVQAQPDAPDHLGQVRLAQVGVGIGVAGLGA